MCRTPEDGLGFPWLRGCDGKGEKALTICLERQRQLSRREREISVPLSTDEEKCLCSAATATSERGVEGEYQGECHDKVEILARASGTRHKQRFTCRSIAPSAPRRNHRPPPTGYKDGACRRVAEANSAIPHQSKRNEKCRPSGLVLLFLPLSRTQC